MELVPCSVHVHSSTQVSFGDVQSLPASTLPRYGAFISKSLSEICSLNQQVPFQDVQPLSASPLPRYTASISKSPTEMCSLYQQVPYWDVQPLSASPLLRCAASISKSPSEICSLYQQTAWFPKTFRSVQIYSCNSPAVSFENNRCSLAWPYLLVNKDWSLIAKYRTLLFNWSRLPLRLWL